MHWMAGKSEVREIVLFLNINPCRNSKLDANFNPWPYVYKSGRPGITVFFISMRLSNCTAKITLGTDPGMRRGEVTN